MFLNVHNIIDKSEANGPGIRAVIWVQGCSLKCPGCFNHETHSFQKSKYYCVEKLAEQILAINGIEGVTYSGGEPFEQAEPLVALSNILQKKGLSIVSYSGFSISELRTSKDCFKKELLAKLDILIDGRYDATQRTSSLLWRGSRNQQVHFLTDRYQQDKISHLPSAEIHIGKNIKTTGIPGGSLKLLRQHLKKLGVEIEG